jgi:DNA-binding MarR family transcriptional regulator
VGHEPSRPLSEPQYFLLEPMRSIEQRVHREMLQALASAGYREVRVPHIAFLAHMTTDGRRLTEFAELMQVTKAAVTQLVDHLERHGLVERVPDPTDRRATIVRATPAADVGFAVARDRLAHIESRWERSLGRDQLRTLTAQLYQLAGEDPGVADQP